MRNKNPHQNCDLDIRDFLSLLNMRFIASIAETCCWCIVFVSIIVFSLPSFCSPLKSRACPCSVSPLCGQTRIKGKIKASLHVFWEVVRITLLETQREASAYALYLCKVTSNLKFLTFLRTIALQHCKSLWWRSGCSVLCPFYWVIGFFLSLFSSAGFEIISSLRCPGYWTYQAMKMQSTSFQDDSATRPRESASFCR